MNNNSTSSSTSLSPTFSSHSLVQSNSTNNNNHNHHNDLEEKYSDSSLYPCPSKFEKLIPLEERYITYSTFLKNKSSETTFIGLLTSQKIYKIDPDSLKRVWSIDLCDIHSIEGDESIDPKTLKIVYHIRHSGISSDGAIASGINGNTGNNIGNGNNGNNGNNGHLSGNYSLNNESNNPELSPPDSPTLHSRLSHLTHNTLLKRTSDTYISEKILIAESEEIRDQWLISLKYLTRQIFQRYFEIHYVPAPSIYQLHLYVYKTNRKGKNQIRCIVISTERLYNVSVKQPSLELGKVKWSFPISALKNVQVFKSPSNVIILNLENKENPKVKETQQFILKDTNERNLLMNEIRRIFFRCTKNQLTKEEKDEMISKSKSKSK